MRQVEDYEWLSSPLAQRHWLELCLAPATHPDSLLKRLRSILPVNYASVLIDQLKLLPLAKRKVSNPKQWFWTRQLLEQASDQETASETAMDFPVGSRIVDICSGAGADSIALANRGHQVTAIDRCPIACELTKHNAKSHGLNIETVNREASETVVEIGDYVHIDPDRRADGNRSSSLERLSPGWEAIKQLLARCRGMSLKIAPGTRVDLEAMSRSAERIPDSLRFLSKDGSVRQQRWYWGLERWPIGSITASMLLNTPSEHRALQFKGKQHPNTRLLCGWFHETFLAKDVAPLAARILTQAPLDYVGDYDPSIRAAEMSVSFANRYGWRLIDSDSGYLTASTASVHPMVRWFQVLDVLPLDKRQIKSYARDSDVHTWELKSRGLEVELTALRKILPCASTSKESQTILCTKMGGQHRAIFCKEVTCD